MYLLLRSKLYLLYLSKLYLLYGSKMYLLDILKLYLIYRSKMCLLYILKMYLLYRSKCTYNTNRNVPHVKQKKQPNNTKLPQEVTVTVAQTNHEVMSNNAGTY